MGCCSSSNSKIEIRRASAKIVSLNGFLREYPVPVDVAHVLEAEASSSSSSSSSWFLCNSDMLYYNDYVPALDSQDNLEVNQIYFVLPKSSIHQRLTASDMVTLAIKASTAIQNHTRKNSCYRITPAFTIHESPADNLHHHHQSTIKNFGKPYSHPLSQGLSRSASVRRLQSYTSKRAKMALRSFRLKLSPIYEGTIL